MTAVGTVGELVDCLVANPDWIGLIKPQTPRDLLWCPALPEVLYDKRCKPGILDDLATADPARVRFLVRNMAK